jgi:diguanylate cyclase (GGDEF)-like protein
VTSQSQILLATSMNSLEEPLTLIAAGVSDSNGDHLGFLRKQGFIIETYPTIKGLKEYILSNIPNILLLDLDALGPDVIKITSYLKENPMTYTKPVIIVIGKRDLESEIRTLEAGAEDFIEKPFPSELLSARIQTSVRRNIRLQVSNPLTGLPGAVYIEELTSKRLLETSKVAMCYTDINDFKAFNDKYGYRRGDNVLRILATILNEAISMYANEGDFVGHIGGDDFVMIVDFPRIDETCNYVTQSFDTLIPYQYDQIDRDRGYIISKNRQGEEMRFPIMTVSIGIVTNKIRDIQSYLLMTELAAEMKEFAKNHSKSSTPPISLYKVDKRID